jgi:hypothetical protein
MNEPALRKTAASAIGALLSTGLADRALSEAAAARCAALKTEGDRNGVVGGGHGVNGQTRRRAHRKPIAPAVGRSGLLRSIRGVRSGAAYAL